MSDTAPNEDEGEIPREKLDALHEAAVLLEAGAQKMGLYAQNVQIAARPPEPGEDGPQVMLVGHFLIGDLAFTDRVQNPEADATEDTFRQIASSTAKENYDDLRAKLERRVAEGKQPLGGDEDD